MPKYRKRCPKSGQISLNFSQNFVPLPSCGPARLSGPAGKQDTCLAFQEYIYNLYRDRVFGYLIDEFDVECLEHREARLLAAVDLPTKRNKLQVRKFD